MKKLITAVLSAMIVMTTSLNAGDYLPYNPQDAVGAAAFMKTEAAKETAKTGLEGTIINTYLIGKHMSVADAEAKLKAAGFEIVANYASVKKGTTIVFTDAALKAQAAKPMRSNVAVMRLFVDDQEKMISITNPVYFGKAFMQEEYDHTVFNAELEKINKAFPGLKASKDEWEFDGLSSYHFMISMPYYKEVDVVGEGTNEELLAKAKSHKKGKGLIFELKLSDTTTLLGYALSKRTSKFVKKIGRANAGILPYCLTISDGKATALSAKYYIAISYPLLDMNGFMGIMTIPGAVIKDYEKVFK
ncbi:hypothetical protein JHD46_00025 [Sulfurimonas sp. SAG-AH-194-C20]|nr:hypothetical protein [Sulfurimonas sp. SAG-AH-194-C20]MDF1878017.1 hypothetical protein [Sulfurimonas sp. SAG-AH-194-C20]